MVHNEPLESEWLVIKEVETMQKYLYLSIFPEALVASMLSPEEFGNYYAVGDRKRNRGQAMFFEVDPAGVDPEYFDLSLMDTRCVPHADGAPKRSVYLGIYRTLEHVPTTALKQLYLVTDDGRVLGLSRGEYAEDSGEHLHLYQELAPGTTRVVSRMPPRSFGEYMTRSGQPISIPRIAFTELMLDELADDPAGGSAADLPYPNIFHLRDCLTDMVSRPERATKTVIRFMGGSLLYRTIKGGIFVGDPDQFVYYPLPSREELERTHYVWWRSAQTVGFAFS